MQRNTATTVTSRWFLYCQLFFPVFFLIYSKMSIMLWDVYEYMIREINWVLNRRYKKYHGATNSISASLCVLTCFQCSYSLTHPTDCISSSHFRNPQLLFSGSLCIFVEPRIQSPLIYLAPELHYFLLLLPSFAMSVSSFLYVDCS